MSYGVKIESSSGFIQIDSTFENITVLASGTGTAGTTNVYYPVALPSGTPSDYLVFAKPSTESGAKNMFFSEFTSVTGYDSFVIGTDYFTTSTFSYDYVVAIRSGEAATNTSPEYGLEVFKANGTDQVFSSNNQNFRCEQVAFNDIYNVNVPGTTFSVFNMSDVFTLMSGKSFVGRQPIANNQSLVYCLMAQFDYSNSAIGMRCLPAAVQGTPGGAFGCGYRTNLIGKFV